MASMLELRTRIEDTIEEKLKPVVEKINEEISSDGYELYIDSVHVDENEKVISVEIAYTRKYLEISEAVQRSLEDSEALNGEPVCITEEECEKVFAEAYRETLKEINQECVIKTNARIELKDYDVTIDVEPYPCDGDYCDCGTLIAIAFKTDKSITEMDAEAEAEYIARFIGERLPHLLHVIL
jgi:hypothetical protein